MSTRSLIFIKEDHQNYHGIYCHNNGYPSYNGDLLLTHYLDLNKIQGLIALGNISRLGCNLFASPRDRLFGDVNRYSENTDYLNLPKYVREMLDKEYNSDKYTSAYHRDWLEDLEDVVLTPKEFASQNFGMCVYTYVYRVKEQAWYCSFFGKQKYITRKLTRSFIDNFDD